MAQIDTPNPENRDPSVHNHPRDGEIRSTTVDLVDPCECGNSVGIEMFEVDRERGFVECSACNRIVISSQVVAKYC